MKKSSLPIIVGMLMAVGVPAGLSHAMVSQDRLELGLTTAPFGWRIVLIVHLIAAIPLGLLTAMVLGRSQTGVKRIIHGIVLVCIGIALLWGLNLSGPTLMAWQDRYDMGFLTKALIRTVCAYLLVVPWILVTVPWAERASRLSVSPVSVLAAAIFAFLPACVYVNKIVEKGLVDYQTHRSTGRPVKSLRVLAMLSELGSGRTILKMPKAQLKRELAGTIAEFERVASAPLLPSAPSTLKLERGFVLISLDRLNEAEAILKPLQATSPDAALLLGALYRDQERWSDAEQSYRQVTKRETGRGSESQERLAIAYEGLATTLTSSGRPEASETTLLEARNALPRRAGYFTYLLGRHHISGGRPFEAINQLTIALQLDPRLESKIRPLLVETRTKTPACLLGSSGVSK